MIRRYSLSNRPFWRNDRGATAVEFALIAVPLVTLIFAAIQIAIIFFYDQALQTATQKGARQLLTGSAQNSNLTKSQFQAAICSYLPSQFTCSNVAVDVQSSQSFSTVNTAAVSPNNVTTTYSPGAGGDIVILRVMYDWPILGGPLALGLANQPDGGHLLIGTAVFKNEPFQ